MTVKLSSLEVIVRGEFDGICCLSLSILSQTGTILWSLWGIYCSSKFIITKTKETSTGPIICQNVRYKGKQSKKIQELIGPNKVSDYYMRKDHAGEMVLGINTTASFRKFGPGIFFLFQNLPGDR